jgi:hypothetical protein
MELGWFLVVVAHEELVDGEPVPLEQAHTHQKGVGTGAPCQAGGLGIHKSHVLKIHFGQSLVTGQASWNLWRPGQQIGERVMSMAIARLIGFAVQEKGPAAGVQHLTGDQAFDGLSPSLGPRSQAACTLGYTQTFQSFPKINVSHAPARFTAATFPGAQPLYYSQRG